MKRFSKTIIAIVLFFTFAGSSLNAVEETASFPVISSPYAAIYNLNDHEMMWSRQANQLIYPASMTKVMTALVAIDVIDDIDKQVTMSSEAFVGLYEEGASVAGFKVNQVVTYRDLLYGLLLPSGADAANQLAISLFGSTQLMVDAMNVKANTLGMKQTKYGNVTGLHNSQHYTTVEDLIILFEAVLKNDMLREIVDTKQYQISDEGNSFSMTSTIANMQTRLGRSTYYITGGKTGYTPEAGMCLIAYSKDGNQTYITVVAGAEMDDKQAISLSDTEALYRYYFDQYERKTIIQKGDYIADIPIAFGNDQQYQYRADKDYDALLKKTTDIKDLSTSVKFVKNLEAPIEKGQHLGNYEVHEGERQVFTLSLQSQNDIKRNDFQYYGHQFLGFMKDYGIYVLFIIFVSIISFVFYQRRKKA